MGGGGGTFAPLAVPLPPPLGTCCSPDSWPTYSKERAAIQEFPKDTSNCPGNNNNIIGKYIANKL